jgi:hypothetical protein
VPLRSGEPRAITIGFPIGIGALSSLNRGFGDLEIWWEYLETARTLFRAAQTMTDRAIAGQLKALADDYERRAEKASHVDAAKAFARSDANAEGEWLAG